MSSRPTTARAIALGATLTVLVAGAAGCGSSSSTSSSSSNTGASTPAATTSTPAAAPAAATGGVVKVSYKDFAIAPAEITVKAGQKIVWTNGDATQHNVVVKPGAPEKFTSKDFGKGETVTFTPKKPGVYSYLCTFHAGSMQGKITVQG